MAGRPRRGVKFPHKQQSGDGRRASFSEPGEEPGSPALSRSGTALDGIEEKPLIEEQPQSEYEKKKANFITRTFWTFVMIGGFFTALFMGHVYIILIITAIQIVSFKEVIAIASVPSRARDIQSTKSLNWYWLATTMYFLYGESVIYYFKHIVFVGKTILPLATHHRFISFILYIIGFLFFVATLRPGCYKFQFTNFGWTHMALFVIVVQAHFIMNNVFEGMIWFFMPAALVITNDIFAYICGITFGRTQLIKLSPKKTVEGFVGAWIMTAIFAIFLTNVLLRSKYFICPATNLGANIFSGLDCTLNPVFVAQTYTTPDLLFLPPNYKFSITMAPMQIHAFIWATFASLIAPFGGFFASGLKRTFKIKDFGDSIPGHGGITDRMDCQFIMGLFAYVYYHTFLSVPHFNSQEVVETVLTEFTTAQQVMLFKALAQYLGNRDHVNQEIVDQILQISDS
jgi:phosphatidate cytidylyltransferase